jgi:acyl-CoA hydrolase
MDSFERMKSRRQKLPKVDLSQGRTIAYSRSTTSRLMDWLDSNVRGNVHGGVIMRMVDEAAAIVAIKHAQRSVVTARIDRFDFIAPVYLGDLLSIHCEMNYVGRSSMEIGVKVVAEDLISGEQSHVASSQVIYVALDENGRPTPVPPLIAGDDEEQAIIDKARKRRLHMQKIDEEMSRHAALEP